MSRFRRRLLALAAMRNAVREDFIPCEYIENTTTAYIDTKVYGNTSTKVNIDVMFYSLGTQGQFIWGNRNKNNTIDSSGNRSSGFYINGTPRFALMTQRTASNYADYTPITDTIYHCNGTSKSMTVTYDEYDEETEETVTKSFTFTNQGTAFSNQERYVFLFNVNQPTLNTSYALKGRCYGCKMYRSNVLVRDYVPMYRISTDEYGLYDTLNDKFYGSANSAKFFGHLIINDDYLKGILAQEIGNTYGSVGFVEMSNLLTEKAARNSSKLIFTNLTSTFNRDVQIYGIKTNSTQRLVDCYVKFNINNTTNYLSIYMFYKRWGYYNGNSSYSGIASIWSSYGGYYCTFGDDSQSTARNAKYFRLRTIDGYRPQNYSSSYVQVLVNSDDI